MPVTAPARITPPAVVDGMKSRDDWMTSARFKTVNKCPRTGSAAGDGSDCDRPPLPAVTCSCCEGHGRIATRPGNDPFEPGRTCPECHGAGHHEAEWLCGGCDAPHVARGFCAGCGEVTQGYPFVARDPVRKHRQTRTETARTATIARVIIERMQL